jgi:hypothetical protein
MPVFLEYTKLQTPAFAGKLRPGRPSSREFTKVQYPKWGLNPRSSANVAFEPFSHSSSHSQVLVKKSHLGALGRMGRIVGRLGTDVGTDKMCRIVNVYRPWDGGTDKLGINWGVEKA